jgi:hypothetical protein
LYGLPKTPRWCSRYNPCAARHDYRQCLQFVSTGSFCRVGASVAINAFWGQQLRSARRAYEERHDTRLSYAEIGRRVGAKLERPAFSATSARAWFVEGQEPDSFVVVEAIAAVLEADPGFLAFPSRGPIATIDIPDSVAIALSEQRRAERARTGARPEDEPAAHPTRQAKVAGGRRGSNRPKDRR